jgi:hypothetical protein
MMLLASSGQAARVVVSELRKKGHLVSNVPGGARGHAVSVEVSPDQEPDAYGIARLADPGIRKQ